MATLATLALVATGTLAAASTASAAPLAPSDPASAAIVPAAVDADFKALVFSKTAGFRHGSIPAGVAAIEKLGEENNFEVDTTEDGAAFTEQNLAQYDVVIWLSTTGDVLDATQQAAFEAYIQGGGGYAGVHAASDTEYDWPWYGKLVGAYFSGHPAEQNATIKVEDHAHPSSSFLDDTWTRFDEWYNFRTNPRSDVHVLMSLDEKSYTGGSMGIDHPTAWCQNYDGGTSWYTGGGHTDASFSDTAFLTHLLGGIKTAAGAEAADCNATQSDSYELVPLDTDTGNPMAMDIADDSTVFYAERNGRVQRIDPVTLATTTALTLPVTLANEDGLLGIVLDPDFSSNGWVYTYWAPTDVGSDGPHNKISRFTYNPASKQFDPGSEKVLLKVTTQRNTCCHAGGDMLFDNDGNLVLATGDNTNPFESDGYAPIDERSGRQDYDAQRSAANTNDLRGKLIRITPQDDGTYTIPAGNLFPEESDSTNKTRPEVYAMGFRNPFRIGLDPYTNNLLVADYGPDAGSASASRGPGGTVEWNIVKKPGNYGWPQCVGIKCYKDYNFSTATSGAEFSATAPINNSPNNTGLTALPPVIVPEWWTENGSTAIYQEIGNSGAPMGGPVYQYDASNPSETKWPEYWDGKAIFAEWNSGRMFSFQLNENTDANTPRHSKIQDINRILPDIFDPSKGFNKSMDFQFGPDGALYVIDWGSDFGGNTANSGVYRVDYVQANPSPIARASSDVTNGPGPSLQVQFSSEGTRHPVGKAITMEWDFGDGTPTSSEPNPSHNYTANGDYTAKLTVTDEDGKTAIANVRVVVGNATPTVTIDFPENGGFFTWGDDVAYKVTVTDPDATGPVNCENIKLVPALGHDSHNHDFGEIHGCEGSFPTARDAGHGLEANLFWVVNANYTDDGGAVGVPQTGYATTVLNSTHMEAEYFDQTGRVNGSGAAGEGVQTEATGDSAGGGRNVSNVETGDWWSYTPVNLKGMDSVSLRIAKGFDGAGNIAVRWNDPVSGQLLGNIPFQPTLKAGAPDWQTYSDFSVTFDQPLPTETGTVYFVLTQGGANINNMDWQGDGVDSNSPPAVTLTAAPKSGAAPLVVNASVVATDPEGTTLSYRWDQGTGAGFQDGTTEQQFVYDTPGSYELKSRVYDADGAYTEKTSTITVTIPGSSMCLTGRSDGFDGPTLDTGRWNSIVRPNQDARIVDGSLVIPATKTDIYSGDNNTPNIVLQDDLPSGAWSATTKVEFAARTQYQQAGLIVYGDDNNYAKFALQGRGTGSSPDTRVFQWIREVDGAPNETAQSNTAALGAAFPDTYFVRITSDGTMLTASYSADGENFIAMPEQKPLAGIVNPRIGLTAYANGGSPAAVIDAHFDWFQITPDDEAVADSPDDEFDGSALDACRWTVLNEQPGGYRVQDGALKIDTTANDIYNADTGVPNFVLQNQPQGDEWVVETKLDASDLDRRYQQGGVILYGDDDNYVKLDLVATNEGGSAISRNLELRSEVGGAVQDPQPNAAAPSNGIVWLRLAKSGSTFTGWSSTDGTTWTQIAQTVSNAGLDGARIGLYALGNPAQGQISNTAVFDYFHVVSDDEPTEPITVSATVSPAAPNGNANWYTQAVTVTVATEGGGSSTVYREYNLDGAGWLEYSNPVVVSTDGVHTVQYRASASDETTEVGSVTFSIDRTKPLAEAKLTVDPSDSSSRTVTVTATDAGSTVGQIEYRLGAGAWLAYTGPIALDATAQTVSYRASDKAGNTSTEGSLEVPAAPVDPEDPTLTVEVTLDPATPNGAAGWYTRSVAVTATGSSSDEESEVSVEYSTDGLQFFPLGASLVLDDEGTTSIWVRASDGEHVSPTVKREVSIDTVVPTVSGEASERVVTIGATDATSGIDRIEYRLPGDPEGVWRSYAEPFSVTGTDASIVTFASIDNAGNRSAEASVEVKATEVPGAVPTVAVDDRSVAQGELLVVTGTGFAPKTELEIWLYSDPIRLATVTSNENGGFSVSVQVPVGFSTGEHHIVVRQGEQVLATSQTVTVTAAVTAPIDPVKPGSPVGSGQSLGQSGSSSLPNTGLSGSQDLAALVMFLLFAGAAVIVATRRGRARA